MLIIILQLLKVIGNTSSIGLIDLLIIGDGSSKFRICVFMCTQV